MIREAISSDAFQVAGLWNHFIGETTTTFTTDLKTPQEIETMIADPARVFLVAKHEGIFCGFALTGPFRGGPGYARTVEHTIYVAPAAKARGIGGRLMQVLIAQTAALNHHVMVAGISATNTAAVRFHQKLGFIQVGHMPEVAYKNGAWLDLILMQKIISQSTDMPPDQG